MEGGRTRKAYHDGIRTALGVDRNGVVRLKGHLGKDPRGIRKGRNVNKTRAKNQATGAWERNLAQNGTEIRRFLVATMHFLRENKGLQQKASIRYLFAPSSFCPPYLGEIRLWLLRL